MSKVELYVYDLSNGLARSMSLQLTGRQIDGIWHTSVVVFGKEIFYGQGISVVPPGTSHHGRPLQTHDLGPTQIDEETFFDYLEEMRSHYTADKYHLLDFNCNSFTNDVVGFLTGGSIPSYIKDLPADFLSTPFGAALRPTIDQMYRRGPPTAPPTPAPLASPSYPQPTSQAAGSLLSSIAAQASGSPAPAPLAATSTLTAPLQLATNPAALHSIMNAHQASAVLFTAPATCAPCRVLDPAFEHLAQSLPAEGLAYVKVDLDVGLGRACAQEWGVRATPTTMFFFKGEKVGEVRGADVGEVKTQVNLLIYQLYPPHPHTQLELPAVRAIALSPILFSQAPDLQQAMNKFGSFLDGAPALGLDKAGIKQLLQGKVLPLLEAANLPAQGAAKPSAMQPAQLAQVLSEWSTTTVQLSKALQPAQLFPLVDFWRLAVLDPQIAASLALPAPSSAPEGLKALLQLAFTNPSSPRPFLLTTLRLLSNLFAHPALTRSLLLPSATAKTALAQFLILQLLSDDLQLRTATASVAFNLAAAHHSVIREALQARKQLPREVAEEGEWVVELLSALVEALSREGSPSSASGTGEKAKGSEEVVHRLTASLALLVYLSPEWEDTKGLLEVLQAREILEEKLGWVGKKDVRALAEEVGRKLC